MQNETDSSRTILEEVYDIIRHNMNRILNIYNVNNTSGLKNYASNIDSDEAKRIFRDQFSHVQFHRNDEMNKAYAQREENEEWKEPKEREWSFFERKVFKKYKGLLQMLEEEVTKSREREDDKKRERWK